MKILFAMLLMLSAALFLYAPNASSHDEHLAPLQGPSFPYDKRVMQAIIDGESKQASAILNCSAHDIDLDGIDELIVCDQKRNAVLIYRLLGDQWSETVLTDDLRAPCGVDFADLDNDGDLDCSVAYLGDLYPNDNRVGGVVVFELDQGAYKKHNVAQFMRRVSDVSSADLDNDGDQDLVIAEFGHAHGRVLWLENKAEVEKLSFSEHTLYRAPGAIHVPLADYDNDGDIDIAVVVSQNDEDVLLFENNGSAQFTKHVLFDALNFDLGSSGLLSGDVDQDGDEDLILTSGDNLESTFHYPQRYHGCYWLENKGVLQFTMQKLVDYPGCYGAALGDLDADGDLDIALVSMVNNWEDASKPSLIWLENNGQQVFMPHSVSNNPIQLVSCCVGQFSASSAGPLLVAGSLHIFSPFERMARLVSFAMKPNDEVRDEQ